MKKALLIISIVLASLLLLCSSLVGVLHIKNVQTFLVNKVADKLSEKLQTQVHIASFHYRPLSHLNIDSIYLSDQQHDTLAYIQQIRLCFDPLAIRQKRIHIDSLQLTQPYINVQTVDSTLNCQFLLDLLQQDSAGFPFRMNINHLALLQTRIRYNDLLVDQFDLDLSLPVVSQDSLDVCIRDLHLRAQLDRLDASFQASLHGNLDSLFAHDLRLVFRNQTIFHGDITVYHPTLLDSLYIAANCADLYCNKILLQDMISQLHRKQITLPKFIDNMGHVHYSGNIQGRIEHLDLHGAFTTALGTLHVNGYLEADTTLQNASFCGELSSKRFHLGQLLNNQDLGIIALHAHVDGQIDSTKLTHCIAHADISQLEYKNYVYNNILVDADMAIEEIHGTLRINDENIRLHISGLADWSEQDTRLDLTMDLQDLRPTTLHLIEGYPDLSVAAKTYISLYTFGGKQNIIDNMTGYIIVDSLQLNNMGVQTTMNQFKLTIDSQRDEQENPFHQLHITSDYLTANLSGHFKYHTLPSTIQNILHQYVPTLVDRPTISYTDNHLDFYAYFRQLEDISTTLNLDMAFTSYPTIKGFVHEDINQFGIQAYIPGFHSNKTHIEDATLSIDNANEKINLSLYILNRLPMDNPTAAKLGDIKAHIMVEGQNDQLDLALKLDNTDSVRNEGIIRVMAQLSEYQKLPKIDIQIQPTHIILNDSAWTIEQTDICYTAADNSLDIDNFSLSTDHQLITANGRASTLASDSIDIRLHNINLDYILTYTEASKSISVMGPVTGQAQLYSVFSEPMLEAQAFISNGGLNGVYLGDITATAMLDRTNKTILIDGQAIDSTGHLVADVQGKVIPEQKWWGLDVECDSVNINFINSWTKDILANPQGRAFGHVKIEGQERLVWVTAQALAKDAQITLPQIGTTFYINDSIFLDSTAIRFPHIAVNDQYGNRGTFHGAVYHENFLNIRYDLWATADNLLVMDLPADQQSFFYGKVFATGDVHIYGDEMDCYIDANARTEANTRFFLNINSASKATNASFINFIQPDTTTNYLLSLLQPKTQPIQINRPENRMRLTLQGDITPQAEIHILLGAEDEIRGIGEGNIKLTYDFPSENVQMQGTYTLQSGLFSFSLANFVRRNFVIREGSLITWDNDPLAPRLDITGHYHTTASLRDLFGSESSQIATNRTSVPVNCVLHMSEELFNPVLSFAIELPQSDESVQSQINSIINTDEMLMRQVIYLLVFNRFYTPDYLQNTQNVGLNETYSLLSSTITGQINAWLSKLTDIFTMGFNFRTDGEGSTASQEYEANFQIHPINPLIINGNFGYRYNDLSNRPFFGDLDIEYLLTKDGKFRAKAFTHTVDKYSLKQANTVQGVGFVFKHDFNWQENKKATNKDKKNKNIKTGKQRRKATQ